MLTILLLFLCFQVSHVLLWLLCSPSCFYFCASKWALYFCDCCAHHPASISVLPSEPCTSATVVLTILLLFLCFQVSLVLLWLSCSPSCFYFCASKWAMYFSDCRAHHPASISVLPSEPCTSVTVVLTILLLFLWFQVSHVLQRLSCSPSCFYFCASKWALYFCDCCAHHPASISVLPSEPSTSVTVVLTILLLFLCFQVSHVLQRLLCSPSCFYFCASKWAMYFSDCRAHHPASISVLPSEPCTSVTVVLTILLLFLCFQVSHVLQRLSCSPSCFYLCASKWDLYFCDCRAHHPASISVLPSEPCTSVTVVLTILLLFLCFQVSLILLWLLCSPSCFYFCASKWAMYFCVCRAHHPASISVLPSEPCTSVTVVLTILLLFLCFQVSLALQWLSCSPSCFYFCASKWALYFCDCCAHHPASISVLPSEPFTSVSVVLTILLLFLCFQVSLVLLWLLCSPSCFYFCASKWAMYFSDCRAHHPASIYVLPSETCTSVTVVLTTLLLFLCFQVSHVLLCLSCSPSCFYFCASK